jgi:2-methylaconitate cis-trans-isomerase PrpF
MAKERTKRLPCVVMRGGTSKAVFLWDEDLPADDVERDRIVLRVFGSPDPRQIDGLGGADPLTSKLAIIGRDAPDGCDLTYTFGQVGIEHADVDYESLCGNITAAVGHFAVDEGLCRIQAPSTTVRIFNTNLRRVLPVEVPVRDGRPVDEGTFAIAGVPGTGAPIRVDLAATAGARSGSVLPTGSPVDTLDCPGVGPVEASLVDAGNPHVFVRAADFGLTGAEPVERLAGDRDLLDALELVRGAAAVRYGMADAASEARSSTPAVPILGLVGPPTDYVAAGSATTVSASSADLVARLLFMQRPHKAYAGTSTVGTGVAAKIPGTLVAEAVGPARLAEETVRIGHPGGVIVTHTRVQLDGNEITVAKATVDRTARRLLKGTVHV